MASLDHAKYNWYPNREINSPLSTYTVSPEPKRFVTELPPDLSEIGVHNPQEFLPSQFAKGRHHSIAIKNFDGGDVLGALSEAAKKTNEGIPAKSQANHASNFGGLSKAFRRHTVFVLNPITEKNHNEEMEWQ